MQGVNQHARPSIIQVGCALDHANVGTADLDYSSGPCHRYVFYNYLFYVIIKFFQGIFTFCDGEACLLPQLAQVGRRSTCCLGRRVGQPATRHPLSAHWKKYVCFYLNLKLTLLAAFFLPSAMFIKTHKKQQELSDLNRDYVCCGLDLRLALSILSKTSYRKISQSELSWSCVIFQFCVSNSPVLKLDRRLCGIASWVQPPILAIAHIAKFGDQM